MSHFTVMVRVEAKHNTEEIHARVSQLLAPYQENNMGDCPQQYLEFVNTSDEHREGYESGKDVTSKLVLEDGTTESPYDNKWRLPFGHPSGKQWAYPEGSKIIEVPLNEVYETFDACMEDYHGGRFDDEHQAWGYYENPNKKWDWWVVGGRWADMIPTNGGGNASIARICDIDNGAVQEKLEGEIEAAWALIAKYIHSGGEEGRDHSERNQLLRLGVISCVDQAEITDEMRESHLVVNWRSPRLRADITPLDILDRRKELEPTFKAVLSPIRPYALLDGERGWVAPGEMGWWGMSSDKIKDKIAFSKTFDEWMASGNQEDWVVLVDCHI